LIVYGLPSLGRALIADVTFENSHGPGVLETIRVGDAAAIVQEATGVALVVVEAVIVAFEMELELAVLASEAIDETDGDMVEEAVDTADEAEAI
jgi:hypothetical protein